MREKICNICGRIQYYKTDITFKRSLKSNANCKKCSSLKRAIRFGDCSVLLEDSLLTYYWIGFIMADGHISNKCRLKVGLGLKDKNHLIKLKDFLRIKNLREYSESVEISIMDTYYISKLCDKFSILQNKTETACKINNINGDLLTALFIGFIDGDGSIKFQHKRETPILTIKCHKAWLNNLNYFSKTFLGKEQAKINNYGYASLNIGTSKVLKFLKEFIVTNNLPILERKWNKIN